MLTNATVRAARARARPYKIFDERGLHLHVAPSGRMTWRMKYRVARREQLLTIGCYPDVSLTDARVQCDAAHASLERGEKPTRPAPVAADLTFVRAAAYWIELRRPGWTEVHAADVETSLKRDVYPAIGALSVRDIRSPAVLKLLRAVEARGAGETARRLRQRISAIFVLAVSEGWADVDPAAIVGGALRPIAAPDRQPAIVDVEQLRALLDEAARAPAALSTRLASEFLALTAVRLAAVRGARWDEIEGLDGPEPMWRVPAARMKLRAEMKLSAANDHRVPLSPAAVSVLRAARANLHCGDANSHDLIFPGRSGTPIGERAIGALYARTRFAGRHVPHGWRASFSTILNEEMPEEREAIDRALGHALANDGKAAKVEGAYNRAQLLGRRRALFDRWGALLTA